MEKEEERLKPKQLKAIDLMSMKDINGMNNKEIAKELGISSRTLYNWKNKDMFLNALNERAQLIQESILTEAYAELRRIALDKYANDSDRVNAIELILQQQGKLTDKQEHNVKTDKDDFDVKELLENL